MIIRMIGALAIILGLMAIMAWMARRWAPRTREKEDGLIEVLATRMIAPKRYVSVVRVGDERLIIGMGEHEMTLLGALGHDGLRAAPREDIAAPEVKGNE